MRQVVVLGAGLDAIGLRRSDGHGAFRVFEVDKLEVRFWKRQHLSHVGIVPPSSLIFVPMDFERDTLSEELQQAGLELTEFTFFV